MLDNESVACLNCKTICDINRWWLLLAVVFYLLSSNFFAFITFVYFGLIWGGGVLLLLIYTSLTVVYSILPLRTRELPRRTE